MPRGRAVVAVMMTLYSMHDGRRRVGGTSHDGIEVESQPVRDRDRYNNILVTATIDAR